MPSCSVSFPFSVGDPVNLKAVPHIGGTVSSMTVFGGSAQRAKVRHFDAEGDSVDREFDITDLAAGAPTPLSEPAKPTASVGAPPSATAVPPTPTPKTAVTVATAAAPPKTSPTPAAPKP